LARLFVEYEANPIEPHFERGTPVYSTVQCVGEHAKNFPPHLRALVKASVRSDRALRKLEAVLIRDPLYIALIGTTQAIDIVQGGVKANALPEEAWGVVNHRIATQRSVSRIRKGFAFLFVPPYLANSSVAVVQERDTNLLEHLAKEFNLTFTAFGSAISTGDGPTAGTLTLTDEWGTALEPAPITPTSEDSAPWQLLSGTIKAAFNAHRGLDGDDNILVSPGIMTGNTGRCCCLAVLVSYSDVDVYVLPRTDTKYYWKLTRHIVRYNHQYGSAFPPNNIHTVNERTFRSSLVGVHVAVSDERARQTSQLIILWK
jgi:Gly-Xaa carboxypeptidase